MHDAFQRGVITDQVMEGQLQQPTVAGCILCGQQPDHRRAAHVDAVARRVDQAFQLCADIRDGNGPRICGDICTLVYICIR